LRAIRADTYTYGDGDTNCNCDDDFYTYVDTYVDAESSPHTEGSSDAGAAPVALPSDENANYRLN
jgi:hypothetical protein